MSAGRLNVGNGTRIIRSELGDIASVPGTNNAFRHAFSPALFGASVQFSRGIVFGTIAHEPTINGAPISGNDKTARPSLKLDPGVVANGAMESWACVEVTPNADGSTDKNTLVEMVHRSEPLVISSKTTGRHPIAMILWNGSVPGRVIPITIFNLIYERTTPAAGKGLPRHYFR